MSEVLKYGAIDACLKVDREAWANHVEGFRASAREQFERMVREDKRRSAEHWRLHAYVVELDPRDWDGYGLLDRWEGEFEGEPGDCSSGCVHYRPLEGDLGADWGVCTNPASHRLGKLTFEHQGCYAFEAEPDSENTD